VSLQRLRLLPLWQAPPPPPRSTTLVCAAWTAYPRGCPSSTFLTSRPAGAAGGNPTSLTGAFPPDCLDDIRQDWPGQARVVIRGVCGPGGQSVPRPSWRGDLAVPGMTENHAGRPSPPSPAGAGCCRPRPPARGCAGLDRWIRRSTDTDSCVAVCIVVCMARLNVYVPDELAERARARGLNVSALTQAAISAELENSATDAWLEGLEARNTGARHEDVLAAIDAARNELGA
jgi:post-segregation antitoxin (ccd killing protein)